MIAKHDISNSDDIIDSRDVIARIEELEAQPELDEEDSEELCNLQALASEGEAYPDWKDEETLIHEDYFETYAQDLAQDIGLIKDDASWPYTCIDWERAASELAHDYSTIEFGGVTYYIRG